MFIPYQNVSVLKYTRASVAHTLWDSSSPVVPFSVSPAIHPVNHMVGGTHPTAFLPAATSVGSPSPGTPGTFLRGLFCASLAFQTSPRCCDSCSVVSQLLPRSLSFTSWFESRWNPGAGWGPRSSWLSDPSSSVHCSVEADFSHVLSLILSAVAYCLCLLIC